MATRLRLTLVIIPTVSVISLTRVAPPQKTIIKINKTLLLSSVSLSLSQKKKGVEFRSYFSNACAAAFGTNLAEQKRTAKPRIFPSSSLLGNGLSVLLLEPLEQNALATSVPCQRLFDRGEFVRVVLRQAVGKKEREGNMHAFLK